MTTFLEREYYEEPAAQRIAEAEFERDDPGLASVSECNAAAADMVWGRGQ